jgi:hypothetical protein
MVGAEGRIELLLRADSMFREAHSSAAGAEARIDLLLRTDSNPSIDLGALIIRVG